MKKLYRKKAVQAFIPWSEEVDMTLVSVSEDDREKGSPKIGDMIGINATNGDDMWLVEETTFNETYELVEDIPEENNSNSPVDSEGLLLAGVAGLVTAGVLTYLKNKEVKNNDVYNTMNKKIDEVKAVPKKDTKNEVISSIKFDNITEFVDIDGPVMGANLLTASHNVIEKYVENDEGFSGLIDLLSKDLDKQEKRIKEGSIKTKSRVLKDNDVDGIYLRDGNYSFFTTTAKNIRNLENAYVDEVVNSKEWLASRERISSSLIAKYKKLTDRYLDLMEKIARALEGGLSNNTIDAEEIDSESYVLKNNVIVYELGDDNDGVSKTFTSEQKAVKSLIKGLPVVELDSKVLDKIKTDLNKRNLKAEYRKIIETAISKADERDAKSMQSDLDSYFDRPQLDKNALFETLAMWYHGDDSLKQNLVDLVVTAINKTLKDNKISPIKTVIEDAANSDAYFILASSDSIYKLVLDRTHDNDSFSVYVPKWNVIEHLNNYVVDTESFESRFIASLKGVDSEDYEISYNTPESIAEEDVDMVLENTTASIDIDKRLNVVSIDSSKYMGILNALSPIYNGFKRGVAIPEDFTWQSDVGIILRDNLCGYISGVVNNHLFADSKYIFVEYILGSECFIFMIDEKGSVYDLVFNVIFVNGDVTLRVIPYDKVDKVEEKIQGNPDVIDQEAFPVMAIPFIVIGGTLVLSGLAAWSANRMEKKQLEKLHGYNLLTTPAALNLLEYVPSFEDVIRFDGSGGMILSASDVVAYSSFITKVISKADSDKIEISPFHIADKHSNKWYWKNDTEKVNVYANMLAPYDGEINKDTLIPLSLTILNKKKPSDVIKPMIEAVNDLISEYGKNETTNAIKKLIVNPADLTTIVDAVANTMDKDNRQKTLDALKDLKKSLISLAAYLDSNVSLVEIKQ